MESFPGLSILLGWVCTDPLVRSSKSGSDRILVRLHTYYFPVVVFVKFDYDWSWFTCPVATHLCARSIDKCKQHWIRLSLKSFKLCYTIFLMWFNEIYQNLCPINIYNFAVCVFLKSALTRSMNVTKIYAQLIIWYIYEFAVCGSELTLYYIYLALLIHVILK